MYPKWISRGPSIGQVLVTDEAEEKKLKDDWAAVQLAQAEEAAAAAKKEAAEAEEAAKLALKQQASKPQGK